MNTDLVRSARGGDRTRKRLPSRDFKSLASTGFATRAGCARYLLPLTASRRSDWKRLPARAIAEHRIKLTA